MDATQKHNEETQKILLGIDSKDIANWMLEQGYFPEQYVLPPCFTVQGANLNKTPYFKINKKINIKPQRYESVSFPNSNLVDRKFGIYDFKIYHDLVWHFNHNWEDVTNLLFRDKNKIYSYSFPIPISSKNKAGLGRLRTGRMIYEYLRMAENDLLKESYKYQYVLKTDIKNFYHSIYSHSISWAIHTKYTIRTNDNRFNNDLWGNVIDVLIRNGNDGCTNGVLVGPVVSDLISEILLSCIDEHVSNHILDKNIDFMGVRYKDDYRFMCNSVSELEKIIKILQQTLSEYNLSLSENKTKISLLPEGLFREWKSSYDPYSLKTTERILYKRFESTFKKLLEIERLYPGTGVADSFLSELTNEDGKIKIDITEGNILKLISMLVHLRERRAKCFPQILAILESIYNDDNISKSVKNKVKEYLNHQHGIFLKNMNSHLYELLWLSYVIQSNNLFEIDWPDELTSLFLESMKSGRQEFYCYEDISVSLFEATKKYNQENCLLNYLKIFKKS